MYFIMYVNNKLVCIFIKVILGLIWLNFELLVRQMNFMYNIINVKPDETVKLFIIIIVIVITG